VLVLVEKVLREFNLLGEGQLHPIKVRLISNGSLMDKPAILNSMRHLAQCNGEVWFKLDAGTKAGIARINDVTLNPQSHIQRLQQCAVVCPTFIQTCMFAMDGEPPTDEDVTAYLALISEVKHVIKGVHLYGLARPSHQLEAPRLGRLPVHWLESLAQRMRQLGFTVHVSD
jgi:hypothetical protein